MGTLGEWTTVCVTGGMFGGFMALLHVWDRKSQDKPAFLLQDSLNCAWAGLAFGAFTTFGWRMLKWPLVLITIFLAGSLVPLGRWRYFKSDKSSDANATLSL